MCPMHSRNPVTEAPGGGSQEEELLLIREGGLDRVLQLSGGYEKDFESGKEE